MEMEALMESEILTAPMNPYSPDMYREKFPGRQHLTLVLKLRLWPTDSYQAHWEPNFNQIKPAPAPIPLPDGDSAIEVEVVD